MYNNSECAVIIDGQLTEWFTVDVEVKQGCLISPVLFNIFLESVMKELKEYTNNALVLNKDLSNDIRYADDTTLVACVFEKLQVFSGCLKAACQKWGMKINSFKRKILSPAIDDITIDGQDVEHVDEFLSLGSFVPEKRTEIIRRIGMASAAFGRMNKTVWNQRIISTNLKVFLYNAFIVPIATYASETWTLTAADLQKLSVFEMRCLRTYLILLSM